MRHSLTLRKVANNSFVTTSKKEQDTVRAFESTSSELLKSHLERIT